MDNWRVGKGATLYYPVAVPGALMSVGDSHASQGDSELCGTAIECSLTGTFQLIVHKKAALEHTALAGVNFPMLETQDDWVLHGFSFANYLAELGASAQSDSAFGTTLQNFFGGSHELCASGQRCHPRVTDAQPDRLDTKAIDKLRIGSEFV
jgi:acetamidase/formamidase